MKRLKALKVSMMKIVQRISRYPSELHHSRDQYIEYDLDEMILAKPRQIYSYFAFEYAISFAFNFMSAIITILFQVKESSEDSSIFKYWLRIGCILNFVSLFPKLIILIKAYKIPLHSESLIGRRLMMLIRTNVFSWNVKITYILYIYYIIMLGKLASTNTCRNIHSDSYRLCHFIICSFLLRLWNLFMRFFAEFCFTGRSAENSTSKGARLEEINEIPVELFADGMIGKSLEDQWCGICLLSFKPGEEIKRLPCSKKHFFHRCCADRWLAKRSICPYCRRTLVFTQSKNNCMSA